MLSPFAELRITDGITSVDLLGAEFALTEWLPTIAPVKDTGIWADSSLAHGRRMRAKPRQNAIETYVLEVRSWDADTLIRQAQNLRRLLEQAVAYWTDPWRNMPVWLEAVGLCETNTRYALIKDYRTPNDGDPYGEPFVQGTSRTGFSEWALVIEREPFWRSAAPGTGTCVPLGIVFPPETLETGLEDAWLFATASGALPSVVSGAAPPVQVEYGTFDVDLFHMDFDQTVVEYSQWQAWMPDDWDTRPLYYRVAWTAAAGTPGQTVRWQLQGRSYGDETALDQAWGAAAVIDDTLLALRDVHYTSLAGPMTVAGTPLVAGQVVLLRLSRDPASDDLAADARLIGLRITYSRLT